jgi:GNAT superfamily N-acetyltransferase
MIRAAAGDADLGEWVRIRNAVEPHEAVAADDMRADLARRRDRRLFLAELDGELVGCSTASRSESVPISGFVLPRVMPHARRRGVGSALLRAGSEHARRLGCTALAAHVDASDAAGLAFAAAFDFVETERQVELVRTLASQEEAPAPPRGIELVELAQNHLQAVREIAFEAGVDMPLPAPPSTELVESWVQELVSGTSAFVALAGDEVVGFAGLSDRSARGACAENNLTAVRRDKRGHGIAVALKQALVHWAAERGYRELQTWTQNGNDAMQAVNERVGYRPGHVAITVRGALLP